MKKYRTVILAFWLCLSVLIFAGCGKSHTPTAAGNADGQAVQAAADSAASDISVSAEEENTKDTGNQSSDTAEDTTDPAQESSVNAYGLADGTYVAVFKSDSSMFHINEAYADKGILTVKNGEMTMHITLQSKSIVNLYEGVAEDAAREGAELLEPTADSVTYVDGITDEVYGFDIHVPAIGEEFDLALIGTHGNWYDHRVMVYEPVEGDEVPVVE